MDQNSWLKWVGLINNVSSKFLYETGVLHSWRARTCRVQTLVNLLLSCKLTSPENVKPRVYLWGDHLSQTELMSLGNVDEPVMVNDKLKENLSSNSNNS